MPWITWIFAASTIAGVTRIVLGVVGAFIITYIGHEFVIEALEDAMYSSDHGWVSGTSAIFTKAGIWHCMDIILAGFSARLTLVGTSALRFGRT